MLLHRMADQHHNACKLLSFLLACTTKTGERVALYRNAGVRALYSSESSVGRGFQISQLTWAVDCVHLTGPDGLNGAGCQVGRDGI